MAAGVFMEDAVETKNVIKGNLVVGTRPCFSCLNSDMTPASYWIVNGDNYIENNIAAGSSHYGFWFFPERHVVGASGREPGSAHVCPPNTPLVRFADNEAHNCRKYGFRLSAQGGIAALGLPLAFSPRPNPCAVISDTNMYQTAQFLRCYAWRNGFNGLSVGDVAATHFVDFVAADNGWRNIEFNGVRPWGQAKHEGASMDQALDETGAVQHLPGQRIWPVAWERFDGGWGSVALIRPVIIGHDLPCPACDRDPALIHWGADGAGIGGVGGGGLGGGWDLWHNIFNWWGWDGYVADRDLRNHLKSTNGSCSGLEMEGTACSGGQLAGRMLSGRAIRHGLVCPHATGLYVYGAKFINYDRPGMVAVSAAHRNCGNCPYGIRPPRGAETRFRKTSWYESDYRVRWRWENEALLTDLDGTFADQPFCKGCSVLANAIVWDPRSIPECYPDARYGWGVCKPDVHFAPFFHDEHIDFRGHLRHFLRRNASRGAFMDPKGPDMAYLADKWLPEGFFNLVQMDVSTDAPTARLIGERDGLNWADWKEAVGEWLGPRTLRMTWWLIDNFDGGKEVRTLEGELDEDLGTLTWVNGSDLRYGLHQLLTHVPWHRCSVRPDKCANGAARYEFSRVPHSNYHGFGEDCMFLLANQRYTTIAFKDNMGLPGPPAHLNGMVQLYWSTQGKSYPGEWFEFETRPKRAFREPLFPMEGYNDDILLQPKHALPTLHRSSQGALWISPETKTVRARIGNILPTDFRRLAESIGLEHLPSISPHESDLPPAIRAALQAADEVGLVADGSGLSSKGGEGGEGGEGSAGNASVGRRLHSIWHKEGFFSKDLTQFVGWKLNKQQQRWQDSGTWQSAYHDSHWAVMQKDGVWMKDGIHFTSHGHPIGGVGNGVPFRPYNPPEGLPPGVPEQRTSIGYNIAHESTVFRFHDAPWCLQTSAECVGEVPCAMKWPHPPWHFPSCAPMLQYEAYYGYPPAPPPPSPPKPPPPPPAPPPSTPPPHPPFGFVVETRLSITESNLPAKVTGDQFANSVKANLLQVRRLGSDHTQLHPNEPRLPCD